MMTVTAVLRSMIFREAERSGREYRSACGDPSRPGAPRWKGSDGTVANLGDAGSFLVREGGEVIQHD